MTKVILIDNFKTFSFPPTVILHATKRQKMYTKFFAQSKQILVEITYVQGCILFAFPGFCVLFVFKQWIVVQEQPIAYIYISKTFIKTHF